MRKGITALIVDNSDSMRMVLAVTLRDAGITVVETTTGEEAFTYARRQQFDFIITDINLPKMDGLNLIKLLRSLPNYKRTPIFSLADLNSDKLKQELKSVGATGWIQKNFDPNDLLKSIKND